MVAHEFYSWAKLSFGMTMSGLSPTFRYPGEFSIFDNNSAEYNNKEHHDEMNLCWSDYGARWYDPQVGRWWSSDPLADRFANESPYVYGGNDPVSNVDIGGMFKFSAATIALMKDKYPTAYKYLYENVINGVEGNILELTESQTIIDAIIRNNFHSNLHNNRTESRVKDFVDKGLFHLSKEDIFDAFNVGGGQEIIIKDRPGDLYNADLDAAMGYNFADDGKDYSTAIQLNTLLFTNLENASTPEEKQAALLALTSVIIHEFLEDFGHDSGDGPQVYDPDYGYYFTTFGIYDAQYEIYGRWAPSSIMDGLDAIRIRGINGTNPDPTVIPIVPR